MRSALVVGGGLAGCAAALRLSERGWAVTLLERHPRLGGRLGSFRHRGRWVDNGTHVTAKGCTALRSFLQALGASDGIRWQARLRIPLAEPGGRMHVLKRWDLPSPWHLLPGLLDSGLLPFRERLALRHAFRAARETMEDPEPDFRNWLLSHGQGGNAVRRFFDPLCYAVLNAGTARAGARAGAWMLREAFGGSPEALDLGLFAKPQGELMEDVATGLARLGVEVRTGSGTESIRIVGGRAQGIRLRSGEGLEADALVLAVPWEAAARLLPGEPALAGTRGLEAAAILSVTLWLDQDVLPKGEDFLGLLDRPAQWAFRKLNGSLSLVLSGSDSLTRLSGHDLIRTGWRSLTDCLPAAAGARILDAVVMKERRATFLPAPGSERLRPSARLPGLEGLALAGAWTATGWPATLEGAVRSGFAAAEALA